MAKRRTTTTVVDDDVEERERAAAAAAGVTEDDEEPEDDLSRVLGELGESSNAVVKVERLREGKSPEFVDDFTAEGFSLKMLQKTYGGGEYKLTARAQGRFVFRRVVSIAQPLNLPEPQAATRMDALADAIKQGFDQQNKFLMQMMLLPRGEGGATSRASVLEELRTMKEIFGTAPASGATPDKMIELVKLGVELAGEGGEQNLLGVLTKALDTFGEPLKEAIRQQHAAPGAGAKPLVPGANRPEHPMKKHVATLIEQARFNSDPALWAEVILERVPEPQVRAFLEGDPIMKLAEFDRRVLDNVKWFESLGAELRALLDENAPDAGNADSRSNTSPGADADPSQAGSDS